MGKTGQNNLGSKGGGNSGGNRNPYKKGGASRPVKNRRRLPGTGSSGRKPKTGQNNLGSKGGGNSGGNRNPYKKGGASRTPPVKNRRRLLCPGPHFKVQVDQEWNTKDIIY